MFALTVSVPERTLSEESRMHHDDLPVGRVLPRRHALGLLGMVGAALAAGTGTATASAAPNVDCVATPEMVEGPYFVDEKLRRSDIRTDPATGKLSDGALVALNLRVLQIADGRCTPLPGATVDLWHCDAVGLYSDEADANTVGQKFLRGYQISDRGGQVRFTTILPGWYPGRTVHHHVKIRTTGTDGNAYEFTSQLYYPEQFKAAYLAKPPYAAHGTPDTTNAADQFYGTLGDQLLLNPRPHGRGHTADFTVALDLSDTKVGAPDGGRPGQPG